MSILKRQLTFRQFPIVTVESRQNAPGITFPYFGFVRRSNNFECPRKIANWGRVLLRARETVGQRVASPVNLYSCYMSNYSRISIGSYLGSIGGRACRRSHDHIFFPFFIIIIAIFI